jgi:hypothetical protein
MARQTSIDCYNQIKNEGLLTKRRLEVYELIYQHAPCTSSEAMQNSLNSKNIFSQARARFTELRELGVIYEKGEKKCSVTGRICIEWDLTDNLPVKNNESNNTKKDRVNNTLNVLRQLYKNKSTASPNDWKNVADLIKGI